MVKTPEGAQPLLLAALAPCCLGSLARLGGAARLCVFASAKERRQERPELGKQAVVD